MLQWRIYYANGSTFDNEQGEPWDAPAFGVILILQKHDDPREGSYFQWEDNYYLWQHGHWWAHNYPVLVQYWFIDKYPHPRACLSGETVDNETYNRVREAAKADRDFFE